jgi:hypothetical protein
MKVSTASPALVAPIERTCTTPVWPFEFSLSPITSLEAMSVSPADTGFRNRQSA